MKDYTEYPLFIAMASFWGLNYVMVKYALLYDGAFSILLYRVLFGALFSILLFGKGFHFPRGLRENAKVFILSLFNITGFMSLWFIGETTVNASMTSIVIYSYPLIVTVMSYFTLNEEARLYNIIGTVLGFAGLIVIFAGNLRINNYVGVIFLMLGAISWSIGTIYYKKYFKGYSPSTVNSLQLLYAIPIVLIMTFFTGGINAGLINVNFVLIMVYMGSLGTAVAYFIYLQLYAKYRVTSISSYFFMVPALSVIFSFFLLHTVIKPISIAGFAVMSAGIYLSSKR